ncbi:uncharacterized protein TNCV_2080741 [Trichonephila clavipes]|nr:uncharacterized protein TNCV_2080741 [Trichonephila clavipes]
MGKAGSALVPVKAVCWSEGHLKLNCLWPRHAGPTPGVMIWGAIYYDCRSTLVFTQNTLTANLCVSLVIKPIVLPFMNSISWGVQQNNARSHTAVVTQRALQSVDMLSWSVGSPNLSPFEPIWYILGRQLQNHPQLALTVAVLTQQVQQSWNSIAQSDIWHLYDTMHARLLACIQNSGCYTG